MVFPGKSRSLDSNIPGFILQVREESAMIPSTTDGCDGSGSILSVDEDLVTLVIELA